MIDILSNFFTNFSKKCRFFVNIGIQLSYLMWYTTLKSEQMFVFCSKKWQCGLAKIKSYDIIRSCEAKTALRRKNKKANFESEVIFLNAEKLKEKIKCRGMSFSQFYVLVKMKKTSFYRKLSGATDFTRGEIENIIKELNLSAEEVIEIFFGNAKKQTD